MESVTVDISFPELEEKILRFWEENNIFIKSMHPCATTELSGEDITQARKSYVFYDGPPFATGLPHYGHLLAGTIKDVIGRFWTMKGFHIDRRFGWDCHGVPVEFEIQKTLGLHGAKAIREYGIDQFNEECRKIVLRYTKEWEQFVKRAGRWVDFNNQYRTMDLSFMESVWATLKSLWDRGLIHESFKCVAYSPAINTPLSNFEANLNYKTVQDPAVTIRAELYPEIRKMISCKLPKELPINAYIWTTTPWTLPSNMGISVGNELDYCLVVLPTHEIVLLAETCLPAYFPELVENSSKQPKDESSAYIAGKIKGKELAGLQYKPFFPYFEEHRANNAFRFYPAEFVTADEGTGVVHLASFGEEDLEIFLKNNIPIVSPIDEDGNFLDVVSDFAGMFIKDADPKVIHYLKDKGLLVWHKTVEHSYPFCWRTDKPLIYRSMASWFVQLDPIRDLLIHCNSQINWVPAHIKDGRFGKWLEGAKDWAISRDRFWGTPIPIWRCQECKHVQCLGSVEELEKLSNTKLTDIHSHFIDHLTFPCSKCEATMKRISQVLDCWFESGSMPYGQAHYPFENKEEFEKNFPADFIAEGLDQTRGWFYTLLVLSTAMFGRPAFRNVIVNGIVLAEDGRKMSKSLRNYPPPDEVMNKHGADALRLYLLSSAATRAEELRFSENGVKQVVRQTLLPLWNAYNFFVTYSLVDRWSPAQIKDEESPNLLDRWILSKTASLIEGVDSALSAYRLYAAAPPILEFVDQLTNWYIRLNRRRFWAGNSKGETEDKMHAYATLHKVLLSFVRVLAPLAPFISEEIFQNLSRSLPIIKRESVHLCPFPKVSEIKGAHIDTKLEKAMELFEEVILLTRTLRNEHNVKIRQPLGKLTVIYPIPNELELIKLFDGYIHDELNIKEICYSTAEEDFVSLEARLNTKRLGKLLGPKLGRERMQELQKKVSALSTAEIRDIEQGSKLEFAEFEFTAEDFLIERKPKSGVNAAASSGSITVVLDTSLSPELRLEGLAREFVNRVQKLRKDFAYEVSDRIIVRYMTACPRISAALNEHADYIRREVLAIELLETNKEEEMGIQSSSQHLPTAQEIDGKTIIIALTRTQG